MKQAAITSSSKSSPALGVTVFRRVAKSGQLGQVSLGAITAPGLMLQPDAVALVKQEHPNLHVSVQIETRDVLMERPDQNKLTSSWLACSPSMTRPICATR